MVKVIDFKTSTNQAGEEFIVLVLQGNPVAVQSKSTGKYYITARKCTIPCTFDAHVAKAMIGQPMEGRIEKVSCDPYNYTVPETGEVIELDYTWSYNPDEKPKVADFPAVQFSSNGRLVHN